jgi:hypothetical protein
VRDRALELAPRPAGWVRQDPMTIFGPSSILLCVSQRFPLPSPPRHAPRRDAALRRPPDGQGLCRRPRRPDVERHAHDHEGRQLVSDASRREGRPGRGAREAVGARAARLKAISARARGRAPRREARPLGAPAPPGSRGAPARAISPSESAPILAPAPFHPALDRRYLDRRYLDLYCCSSSSSSSFHSRSPSSPSSLPPSLPPQVPRLHDARVPRQPRGLVRLRPAQARREPGEPLALPGVGGHPLPLGDARRRGRARSRAPRPG